MTLKEELLDIKRKQNIARKDAKEKVKQNSTLDFFTVYYGDNINNELKEKAWLVLKSFPSRCTYL
jgi:hypothetical protein